VVAIYRQATFPIKAMIESADIIQKVMLVAIIAIAFTVLITMRRKP